MELEYYDAPYLDEEEHAALNHTGIPGVGGGSPALLRQYVQAGLTGNAYLDSSREGVIGDGMSLTQEGAIIIGEGAVSVVSSTDNSQGYFAVFAAGDITSLFAPSDPSLDRIDLVVAQITDLDAGTVAVQVVTGVPDANPSAPDTPDNAAPLFSVLVPAGEDDPTNWIVTDLRQFWSAGFNGGTVPLQANFLGSVHMTGGLGVEGPTSDFAVGSSGLTRFVFHAQSAVDEADDYVSNFDVPPYTRGNRPTLDPGTVTAAEICQVLIDLGYVIDGS